MLQSMASELAKRGHCVSIYAVPFRRALGRTYKIGGYKYLETFSAKVDCDIAYYVYAPLLDRLFRTDAPKIVGVHNFTLWPEFALVRTSTSELMYRAGALAAATVIYNRVLKGRDISKRFDAIHIPNLVAPAKFEIPVYCIPNWFDDDIFKPLSSKNDTFTVLYVGSEAWTKGFDIFLKIYEVLSKRENNINFIAVGLGRRIQKKNMIVYPFINSQEKLAQLYSLSHVTIYPSRADIFGITLIESMACGTPVLTSNLLSHVCFLPKFNLCQSIADYVCKTIKLYKMFRDNTGTYELFVKKSIQISKNFAKKKVFPNFEKMIYETSRQF
ncbi:MAG: glycosyltransferase family 4 protein [Nitrososphaerota archaeon]